MSGYHAIPASDPVAWAYLDSLDICTAEAWWPDSYSTRWFLLRLDMWDKWRKTLEEL